MKNKVVDNVINELWKGGSQMEIWQTLRPNVNIIVPSGKNGALKLAYN